jgi:hypothetical protein
VQGDVKPAHEVNGLAGERASDKVAAGHDGIRLVACDVGQNGPQGGQVGMDVRYSDDPH